MTNSLTLRLLWILLSGAVTGAIGQPVPQLPIPIGAGTAEVWNDSIYYFGGASRWNGTVRYPRVYKFDGNSWSYHDSIPDNSLWDVNSVIVGGDVYLLSGWPSAARSIRKYSLASRTWTYLNLSPNTSSYGTTAEYVNGHIYLFNNTGSVFEYDIAGDSWTTKSPNDTAAYLGLCSAVYNDEIYLVGFYNKRFYKYTPSSDHWTQLAETPYQAASGSMEVFDGHIYFAGGSEHGNTATLYTGVLGYKPEADYWHIDTVEITSPRNYMGSVLFRNKFHILGGFDTASFAVDDVEAIVPEGPFPVQLTNFTAQRLNETTIQIDWRTLIEINNLGFEVEHAPSSPDSFIAAPNGFVSGQGTTTIPHDYTFNDSSVNGGLWYYRLKLIKLNGTFYYTDTIAVDVYTGISPFNVVNEFSLRQNYPNPFNPSTNISFNLPASGFVSLKVYDLLGREVATLVDETRAAGSYNVRFDARSIASGTYLYRLRTPTHSATKKFVLLR